MATNHILQPDSDRLDGNGVAVNYPHSALYIQIIWNVVCFRFSTSLAKSSFSHQKHRLLRWLVLWGFFILLIFCAFYFFVHTCVKTKHCYQVEINILSKLVFVCFEHREMEINGFCGMFLWVHDTCVIMHSYEWMFTGHTDVANNRCRFI